MAGFNFSIPLRKVDEEKRLVYGIVTEEVVDQSGEILDYETSAPNFAKWSDSFMAKTDGASAGNLRLMHQPVVAGKLTEMTFDDDARQILCVAKVVDDAAWKLVLEGCLTGFSMGGRYAKRWDCPDNKGVKRFTAVPVEVSLVDNPCVETATFEVVKADGTTEIRKFHQAETQKMFTEEQIKARAAQLAKAAGTPDAAAEYEAEALVQLEGEAAMKDAAGGDRAEAGAQTTVAAGQSAEPAGRAEGDAPGDPDTATTEQTTTLPTEEALAEAAKSVTQVWQAPDGQTFAKKADAAAHVLAAPVPPPAETEVEKALRVAREAGEPVATAADGSALADLLGTVERAAAVYDAAREHVLPLAKGMYTVRELSDVIGGLRYVISDIASENAYGGRESEIPAELMTHLQGLGASLVALVEEEVSIMVTGLGTNYPALLDEIVVVENAAMDEIRKADGPILTKAGARNSKRDRQTIQKMHDGACELGADCGAAKAAAPEGAALEETDLVKSLRAENTRQGTEIEKAVAGIEDLGKTVRDQAATISALTERVEKFGKQPQPLPPRTDHVTVERFGKTQTFTADDLAKMSGEDKAELMIRLTQSAGGHQQN